MTRAVSTGASGWPEVGVLAAPETSDALEAWLLEAGALAVTLLSAPADAGTDQPALADVWHGARADDDLAHAVLEPAPGEVRLWNALTLVGLFAQELSDAALAAALARAAETLALPLPDYRLSRLAERVWERAWMADYTPMRFGPRFWICPSHHEAPDPEAVTLRLDPGLAFGSGTHPTTALCLEWLGRDSGTTRRPFAGQRIVDYGCGSGVLAIAALLLGAARAHAVDIDPQALRATAENARLNGVATRLAVSAPDALEGPHGPFGPTAAGGGPSDAGCADAGRAEAGRADLLLANILSGPLEALAETFARLLVPGGTLVLSGLLEAQIEPLRLRYNPAFDFAPSGSRDGWASLVATRRPSA